MIITNAEFLISEFEDIIRLFYPNYVRNDSFPNCEIINLGNFCVRTKVERVEIEINKNCKYRDELEQKRLAKRVLKHSLYLALSKFANKVLPWGSMSGIRPTRLGYILKDEGNVDVEKALKDEFGVSCENAKLVADIMANQQGIIAKGQEECALYVHIPICPSRCSYCSFVSETFDKCKDIDSYVEFLRKDIALGLEIIRKNGYKLSSIYFGGGTPTVLSPKQLDGLLSECYEYIESKQERQSVEFTLEAGRADTLTREHLNIFKKNHVTRISVNPQSFCDETLKAIGRNHSSEDVVAAYNMVREFDFDINMDVIAGLGNENLDDFAKTIERVIMLCPENVTVHTLCKKRGSDVHTKNIDFRENESVVKAMTDYALERLVQEKYLPYYLYRQKSMLDNLQNVGFAKAGKQCKNNIDTMEEAIHVIACGSGAISKRLFDGGRIERYQQALPIKIYLERFESIMQKRNDLFRG